MSALVLRTCDEERRSYGGFQWPESGPVTAPDWNPRPVCGGGLHGLLWGEGDLLNWSEDATWLVVAVDEATAGYRGTATAGYRGTATAGDGGTVVIRWWDHDGRYRLTVGYVGDGIKANTPYRCDDKGVLAEVKP